MCPRAESVVQPGPPPGEQKAPLPVTFPLDFYRPQGNVLHLCAARAAGETVCCLPQLLDVADLPGEEGRAGNNVTEAACVFLLRGVVNGLEVQRAYTPISPGTAEGYFEVLIKIMQSGAFGGFYRTPSSHLRLGCSFSGFSVASLLPARRLERVGAAAVLPPPPAACGSSSTHVPPPWPRGPDDYLERHGCWGGPAVFGPLPAPLFLASAGPFSSVTSECYEAGLMSQYIKTWKKGDMVFWRGPFGGFPYRPNKYGELLMLASGTGLAPMLPILQSITENEEDETFVTLVGCFRLFGNIYLKPLLQELARYWNIRIFYVLSQQDIPHLRNRRLSLGYPCFPADTASNQPSQ
nr:PREDICTED: uncharacterized protein LOC106497643 isoform X2 [Apteryx mantelli mantelli]